MSTSASDSGVFQIVSHEVRFGCGVVEPFPIPHEPVTERGWHITDGIHRRAVNTIGKVAPKFLIGFQDISNEATALRMPAAKQEILGVSSLQLIANIHEGLTVAGVVV